MAQPSLSGRVCWLSHTASFRMVCLWACESTCWCLYMCRTGKGEREWMCVCHIACSIVWVLVYPHCDLNENSVLVIVMRIQAWWYCSMSRRLFKENLYPNWMKEEDKLQPNPGNKDWHISANGCNLVWLTALLLFEPLLLRKRSHKWCTEPFK